MTMASIPPLRTAIYVALCWAVLVTMARADGANGYPTAARAEFVFGCMASNGQTQDALRRCSCAIDVIASLLQFDRYENAETVFRMRRSAGGYLGEIFRSAPSNTMVRDLEEARAEAEIRCF